MKALDSLVAGVLVTEADLSVIFPVSQRQCFRETLLSGLLAAGGRGARLHLKSLARLLGHGRAEFRRCE